MTNAIVVERQLKGNGYPTPHQDAYKTQHKHQTKTSMVSVFPNHLTVQLMIQETNESQRKTPFPSENELIRRFYPKSKASQDSEEKTSVTKIRNLSDYDSIKQIRLHNPHPYRLRPHAADGEKVKGD